MLPGAFRSRRVCPKPTGNFDSEDLSAVIAFDGKVGVFWSNQTNNTDYFAVHSDTSSDTSWSGEMACEARTWPMIT